VNTYFIGLRAPIQLSAQWQMRPTFNYKNGYDHYVFVRQNPAIFENKHRTHVIDAGLDNVFNTSWGRIATGLNYRKESINSSNLGERTRDNYGAFLEYQLDRFEKWNVTAGLFLNHNSVFGTRLYPGLDFGYKLRDSWRLYANIGMGQRLPTFTDLYYTGPSNIGNERLAPELLTSYELGTKVVQQNWKLNAAIFYKAGQDFIDWVRPDTMSAWTVENFTSLNTLGAHLDGQYSCSWNKSKITLYTGYTFLNPEIGKVADANKVDWNAQYAINALKHQWVVRAMAEFSERWNIMLGSRLLSRLNAGKIVDGYKRSHYQLIDASLSYKSKNFRIYLDVNNLFDIKYIESGVVPLPGSWLTLGIKGNI
jgi:vitamin B12 transporter